MVGWNKVWYEIIWLVSNEILIRNTGYLHHPQSGLIKQNISYRRGSFWIVQWTRRDIFSHLTHLYPPVHICTGKENDKKCNFFFDFVNTCQSSCMMDPTIKTMLLLFI